MSEGIERGIWGTILVLFVLSVVWIAGNQMGKDSIASDCKRWGEFDRLSKTYSCTVKP